MASIIREALNADQMAVYLFCGGQSKVGFNVSGTWAGTVAFFASADGVRFDAVTVTPFASGTGVQSATGNGSWELQVQNYVAVKALLTRTSGTAVVVMATSRDSSYQDAFLTSTSKYVSQNVGSGATNVVTQAAQTNRAWRLRTLTIGFSVAAGAAVDIKITDGASTVLWEGYVPKQDVSTGGFTYIVPLPPPLSADPSNPDGGVVGTPGNSMVVTLAAPGGSVVSTVNCEFQAA
jgi:hypothetical protein